MTVNYGRPPFPGSFFKGQRGQAVLDKEKKERETEDKEKEVRDAVRERDKKCRFPLSHRCRGPLEVIHIQDRSTGGPMTSANTFLGCRWLHRAGPISIHGKDIEVRPLTKRGADGAMAFYLKKPSETRRGEFSWQLIAKEVSPGVVAK